FINLAFSLMEPVLAESRKRNSVPANAPLFVVSGGQTVSATVQWVRADSAIVGLGGVDIHFKMDGDRIVSGNVPSQHVHVARVEGPTNAHVTRPDYSAPANASFIAEDVTIATKEGFTLGGTFTRQKTR